MDGRKILTKAGPIHSMVFLEVGASTKYFIKVHVVGLQVLLLV